MSFFFGDEFGSLASFLVDAVAAVLVADLFAARHHHRALGGGITEGRYRQLSVDCASGGNMLAPWGSVVYVCPVGAVRITMPSGNCWSV